MTDTTIDAASRDPRTYAIIGSAMEVHRELGPGFLEAVYQEAFALELAARDMPFRREVELTIVYKGRPLACTYKVDFVCFDSVLVELKALAALGGPEHAQVIHYLKAARREIGLLLNFGAASLQFKRVCMSASHVRPTPPAGS